MRSGRDSPPAAPAYESRSTGTYARAIPAMLAVLALGAIVAPFAGMFLSTLLHLPLSETGVLGAVRGALSMAVLALLFNGPLIAFPGALAYALMLRALPQERLRDRYRNHPWLTSAVLGAGAGAAIGAVTSQMMGVAMDFGAAAPLGGAVSSTLGLSVYVRMLREASV